MLSRGPFGRRIHQALALLVLAALPPRAQLQAQQPPNQGFISPAPGVFRIGRNVIYGMYSGLALLMDVFTPEKPNGYGAILIDGSGWAAPLDYSSRPLKNNVEQWNALALPLIRAGYVVFAIDHRATPRFHYPAQLEDAQRAVRFVRSHAQQYGIDPAQIAAVGYSSGAHLASLLGLLDGAGNQGDPDPVQRESARVQCVIAGGIPSDLTQPDGREAREALTAVLGEAVPANPGATPRIYRKLEEMSSIHYVRADAPPFLLIHGDADQEVPYESAELLEHALRAVHAPVKLVTIKGGTHDSVVEAQSGEYADEIVVWLDQYLRKVLK